MEGGLGGQGGGPVLGSASVREPDGELPSFLSALLAAEPQGLRAPPGGRGRAGKMFGYRMSSWCGEGFSQRPLHPSPGLSPQLSSTRFVGG